jgi:oligopeptide/dipeptide ABC transporter ATP-binding protein
MPLLEVQNLKVHFPVAPGIFASPRAWLKAVDDVSFHIEDGETVGLAGESGCGKTTLGRAIVGLVKPSAGAIYFKGRDISNAAGADRRQHRRKIQIIFQDPYASLNPRMTITDVAAEALDLGGENLSATASSARVRDLLASVGLDPNYGNRYPHEFSGGQRQRIGIARALAAEPELIICDEPVSALDVSVQAQIVNLLQDLQQKHGLAYLFIAHDLAVVKHISRRMMVMYLGKVVELANADRMVKHPRHPYTRSLLNAVPSLKPRPVDVATFSGELPSAINPPPGCPYHPRCWRAELPVCATVYPPAEVTGPKEYSVCHFARSL